VDNRKRAVSCAIITTYGKGKADCHQSACLQEASGHYQESGAIKKAARRLRVSEAEIVRMALDAFEEGRAK
jgi:hypothetical protein